MIGFRCLLRSIRGVHQLCIVTDVTCLRRVGALGVRIGEISVVQERLRAVVRAVNNDLFVSWIVCG